MTTAAVMKRAGLQKQLDTLDSALAQHQRKAFEQQQAWRAEQAELEQRRNQLLKELSEA